VAGVAPAVAPWTAIAAFTWNLVGIPAFSPINAPGPGGGFAAICAALALPPDALLLQIDASTGFVAAFTCNQAVAPPFTPCQGVAIWSSVATGGFLPVGAPGVEGTWLYPAYGNGWGALGDHLFPIPLTIQSVDPEALCMNLLLPPGSDVIAFDTANLTVLSHQCGTVPLWALVPGEAVLIRAPGPAGAIVGGGMVPIF
jgi:hypothetical protein